MWLPLTHPSPLPGTWPAPQACARDWESNWQPFGVQAGAQSTEPHQSGLFILFYYFIFLKILFIYLLIFRERGKEREREGEKH